MTRLSDMTKEQLIKEGHRLGFNFEDTDHKQDMIKAMCEDSESYTRREIENIIRDELINELVELYEYLEEARSENIERFKKQKSAYWGGRADAFKDLLVKVRERIEELEGQ